MILYNSVFFRNFPLIITRDFSDSLGAGKVVKCAFLENIRHQRQYASLNEADN